MGLPDPPHRHRLCRALLRGVARASELLGEDRSRRNHVDAHATSGVLERRHLREPDDPVLARNICGQPADGLEPGGRGHVDDCPATAVQHCGDLVLHAQEGSSQVDRERAVEIIDGDIGQRRWSVAPPGRIVEGDVKAAELFDGPSHESLDRSLLANVGRHGDCSSARDVDLLRHTVEAPCVARSQGHRGAGGGERTRSLCADPSACSGDDRGLPFEVVVHGACLSDIIRYLE
jgi:hypothetical protein